jgi:hypothetical protein
MFNDILTGKASLDPKPAPGPYREQAALPPISHACIACGQTYQAPSGSAPGRCSPCHVSFVEENARQSALAVQAGQEHLRRSEKSHRTMRTIFFITACLVAAAIKYGMHAQQRDDAAQAAGYRDYSDYESQRDAIYPADDFSATSQQLAAAMCACRDVACAERVAKEYGEHLASGVPSNDKARSSAQQADARLTACESRLAP